MQNLSLFGMKVMKKFFASLWGGFNKLVLVKGNYILFALPNQTSSEEEDVHKETEWQLKKKKKRSCGHAHS